MEDNKNINEILASTKERVVTLEAKNKNLAEQVEVLKTRIGDMERN